MKSKEVLKLISKLQKKIRDGFNLKCREVDIDCWNCRAIQLMGYLQWLKDVYED